MMQKVKFLEFAELKQGDGKGPQYFAGKAYWLSPDQAERWKSEGVAEDAPADMPAENEPADYRPTPAQVRIVKSGKKFDVIGPADYKFNAEPLTAGEAEVLRARVLSGEVKMDGPAPSPAPAPEPNKSDDSAITFNSDVPVPNDWRDMKPAQMISLAQQLGAKDIKGRDQAGEAITSALFARAGNVEFQVKVEGDVRTITAMKPWPAYVVIAEALLNDPEKNPEVSVKGNMITITVANGVAEYDVVAWNTETVVAALGESTFEAPSAQ